jgi:hypothetical protein
VQPGDGFAAKVAAYVEALQAKGVAGLAQKSGRKKAELFDRTRRRGGILVARGPPRLTTRR